MLNLKNHCIKKYAQFKATKAYGVISIPAIFIWFQVLENFGKSLLLFDIGQWFI